MRTLLLPTFLAAFCLIHVSTAHAQSHFMSCSKQTGNSAVILFPASALVEIAGQKIGPGDEIAAITSNGLCAGALVWKDDQAALTVWGNNEMTETKDGFEPGEEIIFRVWHAASRAEYGLNDEEVTVEFDGSEPFLRTDGKYGDGAIMKVQRLTAEPNTSLSSDTGEMIPSRIQLNPNYPNPFSGTTTFSVHLPETNIVSVTVYNALGQRMAVPMEGTLHAGTHNVTWNASGFPTGVYLVQLRAGAVTQTVRATVIR